ncbi:hypothetical protein [Streptomyces sp. NPDC047968]|uniref:hypothetical protein n=1 Tax=unclassified Streptomyces TaxID=2593676 RepID=UPI0034466307
MASAEEGRQQPDAVGVLNARRTLLQLLGRAGVGPGDAEELIGLVEAGAVSLAHRELAGAQRGAPAAGEPLYRAGWLDGVQAATADLGELAERAVRAALVHDAADAPAGERPPVRRMEVERARVAATPLYLSFTTVSDFDPEVSEQVLTAVLATMGARERAGYAGRLAGFAAEHRERLERLFARYGPGSGIAIHGRYSLVHSPTSIAVLERLSAAPGELWEAWDAGELPPAWLEGLTAAWGSGS